MFSHTPHKSPHRSSTRDLALVTVEAAVQLFIWLGVSAVAIILAVGL